MVNVPKLERKRKKAGLTVFVLTEKIGMTRQSYYDILHRGTTTWKTLVKIAGELDCKPKDLIT